MIVLRGELIIKGNEKKFIKPGDIYNAEGFLLNYSKNENIYCLSDEAILMLIDRNFFLKKMKSQTVFAFMNFLMRQEINRNKYEIETYEKRK